jgi:phage tail sheath protein FI
MAVYKTPGVYVEEISTLPPSVAQVATAIPAFIGYTGTGGKKVERINTLLEYETIFGLANPSKFTAKIQVNADPPLTELLEVERETSAEEPDFLMYYCMSHYFKNGGGSCYVISAGEYGASLAKDDFLAGLAELEKEDEPTLILLTDAVNLAPTDYYEVCQAALTQCAKLGDRFAVLDVPDGDDKVAEFRDGIGINNLMYGAAYYPYLQTSLNYQYLETQVAIEPPVPPAEEGGEAAGTLAAIKSTNTALYNQIKAALTAQRVVLPPSPSVAGVYATVDRTRGVWKAPANVSLSAIVGPVLKITHEGQENLNVDPTAGKSINAIRAFTGKGTLIWGARTLAGNDNEWRYISVRRLFNMIEESTQKATAFAVFEPNDATTWLKVKAMIESYLYGLWEQGALAGPTPDAAYFVNVGLGKTMTAQDILEGRMIVEIGVAAVRPAEFIILRFTHKMQEA